MAEYTLEEKMHELEREVKNRLYVYRKMVQNRKMTQAQMNRKVGIIQEIYIEFRDRVAQGPLFRSADAPVATPPPKEPLTAARLFARLEQLLGAEVHPDERIGIVLDEIEQRQKEIKP